MSNIISLLSASCVRPIGEQARNPGMTGDRTRDLLVLGSSLNH